MNQTIRIPAFLGGVSTMSQNRRSPIELESQENCDLNLVRGLNKRAASEHVAGDGTFGELNLTDAAQDKFIFWIDRSSTERFVGFIDPAPTSDATTVQVWNIVTGAEVVVKALSSSATEVDLDDADADVAAMVAYLKSGSVFTERQRFRSVSVEDATFLLNREVVTALQGSAITYQGTGLPAKVRDRNNTQNVPSWSDFEHPPIATASYPDESTLIAGGDITSDAIWHAEEDDIGLPQGFWWATSPTQPPWFQRLPTEGANSFINPATMPLRLDYDGSKFILKTVTWTARLAGNSTTNPGPTFIGLALSDMSFHQGRFWFTAGERIVSSRAGDIFNLWIDSTNLITDGDPIDVGIQGRNISNGVFLESFRESLVCLTDGARQIEVRANGPITPQSVQVYDSTNVRTAGYVEPTISGSRLYFAGEEDFANIIWQYEYSPTQINNVALDITKRVHGYIPAEIHWMVASETHDQLFALTLADTNAIYVNKADFQGAEQVLNSWYRWTMPDVTSILSCHVFDEFLYVLVVRSSLVYVERIPLGNPAQDVDGSPAQTLGYSVLLDRKVKVQGAYSASTDTTTWTLPYDATASTLQVVLAPTWDTASEKTGGAIVPGTSQATVSNVTEITAPGDWENNADGTDAPAFIGVSYEASATLSEQFVRDQQGTVLHGNTHLMRGRIRHRDSGGYSVSITPEGRSQLTKDFVVPFVGTTPLDQEQLDPFGEFQFRIMAHSRNLTLTLVNDSPFPTTWVDMDIDTEFVPTYSPVR